MQEKYTEEQQKQIGEFFSDIVRDLVAAIQESPAQPGDGPQMYHIRDGKPWPPELLKIAEENGRADGRNEKAATALLMRSPGVLPGTVGAGCGFIFASILTPFG